MTATTSARRVLLLKLLAVVPYPFFILGIPFATPLVVSCFRVTCIQFSMSAMFALNFKKYHRTWCRLALLWNGISSCLVSFAWCAWPSLFLVFQVVENVFQYVGVEILLDGHAKLWHVVLTFSGSCVGYGLREAHAASMDGIPQAHIHRRLHEDEETEIAVRWAVVLVTLVAALVGGMCVLSAPLRDRFLRILTLCQRRRWRRVHSEGDGAGGARPNDLDAVVPAQPLGRASLAAVHVDVEANCGDSDENANVENVAEPGEDEVVVDVGEPEGPNDAQEAANSDGHTSVEDVGVSSEDAIAEYVEGSEEDGGAADVGEPARPNAAQDAADPDEVTAVEDLGGLSEDAVAEDVEESHEDDGAADAGESARPNAAQDAADPDEDTAVEDLGGLSEDAVAEDLEESDEDDGAADAGEPARPNAFQDAADPGEDTAVEDLGGLSEDAVAEDVEEADEADGVADAGQPERPDPSEHTAVSDEDSSFEGVQVADEDAIVEDVAESDEDDVVVDARELDPRDAVQEAAHSDDHTSVEDVSGSNENAIAEDVQESDEDGGAIDAGQPERLDAAEGAADSYEDTSFEAVRLADEDAIVEDVAESDKDDGFVDVEEPAGPDAAEAVGNSNEDTFFLDDGVLNEGGIAEDVEESDQDDGESVEDTAKMLRLIYVVKSKAELRHLAAAMQSSHYFLENALSCKFEKTPFVNAITVLIACGLFELFHMQPKQLRGVALRLGFSRGILDGVDPRLDMIRWIWRKVNASRSCTSPRSHGEGDDDAQFRGAELLRRIVDEEVAAGGIACYRLRELRARLTGRLVRNRFGKVPRIPEEADESDDMTERVEWLSRPIGVTQGWTDIDDSAAESEPSTPGLLSRSMIIAALFGSAPQRVRQL